MPTVFVSAGEVSADIYGAALVRSLAQSHPELTFVGMGGDAMRAAGVTTVEDLTDVSTIGFVEPIRFMPRILRTLGRLRDYIRHNRPDLVIVLDFQGFHMAFLKTVAALNIPVVYFIAPQEWHWGSESGGQKVVDLTQKIICIFPKEAAFYQKLGADAPFVGHPLLDVVTPKLDVSSVKYQLGVLPDEDILAVFPGSRRQEAVYTAPVLFEAARRLCDDNPKLKLVVSSAILHLSDQIDRLVAKLPSDVSVRVYEGPSSDLIEAAKFSLCSSGTIALEHAILGTPCVVAYRVSNMSYWVAKRVLAKKMDRIRFISLPNMILDRRVVPEFIQDEASPDSIAEIVRQILTDPDKYSSMIEAFGEVRKKLGDSGAIDRAAEEIMKVLPHD